MTDESHEEQEESFLERIDQIEDQAWLAARDAAVSRFVLDNLVLDLGRMGLLDARGFMERLRSVVPLHPDAPHRDAIGEFLAELEGCLPPPGGGPGVH